MHFCLDPLCDGGLIYDKAAGVPLLSRFKAAFTVDYGPNQPKIAPMMTRTPSQCALSITLSMALRPQ